MKTGAKVSTTWMVCTAVVSFSASSWAVYVLKMVYHPGQSPGTMESELTHEVTPHPSANAGATGERLPSHDKMV